MQARSLLLSARGLLAALAVVATVVAAPARAEIISATIEKVDADNRTLHLSVAGDNARTVAARVGPGDLLIAREGARVRGELVTLGGRKHLQNIWPGDPRAIGTIRNLARQLRRDTLQRGRRAFRGIGEPWPRFALFDQHGELFLSEGARGDYVIVNFIFTRCTVPNMCPAATRRMADTQKLARERGIENLRLVSITLDPDYDTPGILAAYGDSRGIDFANFSFLTGPEQVIADLTEQMGILTRDHPEEIIQHTMSTTLVDPVGRIFYRVPGSNWSAEAFIRQIERHRENERES